MRKQEEEQVNITASFSPSLVPRSSVQETVMFPRINVPLSSGFTLRRGCFPVPEFSGCNTPFVAFSPDRIMVSLFIRPVPEEW